MVHRQREIHEKYGEIVRLAPDEVSFANEQSYNDIYTFRRGHGRAPRDKIFAAGMLFSKLCNYSCLLFIASNGDVDNIGTTTDPKFHGRVRGLLSHSFTQDALRSQYPIIQHHADTLVAQLKKRAQTPAKPSDHAVINITDWLNYFTMDVIGDLAFGEPFGCLAKGEYHDWVRTLFMYLEYLTLSGVPRYYPLLERLLRMLLPKSVVEGQLKHERYAHERINKRLDSNTSRNDFMSAFMNKNPDFSVMSRKEILSTFNIIIVAGGETTATVLTGIFSHLALNAPVRRRLCEEIRSAFTNEDDITIDATKELKYLDAVLNESLRICNPISSGLPRTVPPGGDTYCGVYLPEGVSGRILSHQTLLKSFRPISEPAPMPSTAPKNISTTPTRSFPNGGFRCPKDQRNTQMIAYRRVFLSALGFIVVWAALWLWWS